MGLDETQNLYEGARGGDQEARNRLLARLRPRIVLWAATRMSPELHAKFEPDDVAQEILIAVSKGFDKFDNSAFPAFLGWLFRVGENRIRDLVDHIRAKKRQPVDPVEVSQTSPSQAAYVQERVHRVRAALLELPPDYQEVIRLRRLQQLDVKQVAEIMKRSENAVRVLYCRALKSLGTQLGTEF